MPMKLLPSWLLAVALAPLSEAVIELQLNARQYLPAGYAEGTTEGTPDLYGYGFGALESSFYDATEQIFYGGSEKGFVTVSDFKNWPEAALAPFGIPLDTDLTDIIVCGELLLILTKDDPNPGALHVFTKSVRSASDDSLSEPELIQSVAVGPGPDHLLVNADCSILATANEGEGVYEDGIGLINPEGSVSIVRGPFDDAANPPSVTQVSLNEWTDDELIALGVHLPLSLNALKYFNSLNLTEFNVDFSAAIANYTTASVLEPEFLAWSADESKLYASLQENNALVIIDVETGTAESIHSYGLKSWSEVPIDVVEDGECVLQPIEGLQTLRSPDSITTFTHNGVDYIVTANEGDDLEYGDFEERIAGEDLFAGTSLVFPGMTADESVFSTSSISEGLSRFFNAECDTANSATPFCEPGMRFTLGTAMVDYSDPTAPNIYQLVGIGGRGMTIYSITEDGLRLHWDSADTFENASCTDFPWAHNSLQDEEFAPVGGTLYNSLPVDDELRETIEEMNDPDADGCADGGNGEPGACPLAEYVDDRSPKDGPAAETVVFGQACNESFLVTTNEKDGTGYVYHLPLDGDSPYLLHTFHLSPASESLNAGLAYDNRTLGEVDAESVQFLSEDESPTGNAAILFAGAWSGTVSLWEFNCNATVEEEPTEDEGSAAAPPGAWGLALLMATGSLALSLL